jgi:TetR/AcrR family transcriptional regulator, fatty acid metabolism regulator protein
VVSLVDSRRALVSKNADDNVRERILDASIRLFLAHGFAGTTVKELTDTAGVAKGTLYWYFKSKNQLLEEILDKFSKELYEGVVNEVNGCEGDFLSKFKLFYKFITELAKEKRELLLVSNTLLGELMGSGTEAEKKMKDIHGKLHRFTRGLLEEGRKEGVIAPDLDTNLQAHIIMADFIGMHLQWCLQGDLFDVVAYARSFRTSILRGLGIEGV